MTDFSNRDPLGRLEDELRARRPSLNPELEQSLLAGFGPARRGKSRRTVTALVLTTGIVGVFTAFGGVGYAFSAHNGAGFSGSASHNCYGGNHGQHHQYNQHSNHHHHHHHG